MTLRQKFWAVVGKFLYKVGYLKDRLMLESFN